jgi:glycosyltransferase involved in cell wall biosynthesis
MLAHGCAGRLVQPGAPAQLASELRDLMQDPAARSALREAARDGSDVFDVQRLVGDYERVYREALRG